MKQSVSIRVAALMAMSLGAGSALAVDVAASPTLSKIKSSGAISIGHRTSSIPFSYYDANQKVIGSPRIFAIAWSTP